MGYYDIKMMFCQPLFMKTIITSEQDLAAHTDTLPENLVIVGFKIVAVGPNTLSLAKYLGGNVVEIVRKQPGYFVLSNDGCGLREAMHDLVDRFCDIQESKDESKNSQS